MGEKPTKPWVFPPPEIIQGGLTLRDWFAGQALAGMASAEHIVRPTTGGIAERAYRLADAMMAARDHLPAADPEMHGARIARNVFAWAIARTNPLAITNDSLAHACLGRDCEHDDEDGCVDQLVADFMADMADLGCGPGRE